MGLQIKDISEMNGRRVYQLLIISSLMIFFAFFSACSKKQEKAFLNGAFSIEPAMVTAGKPVSWNILYRVGDGGFIAGGSLLIRFPHPYYSTHPQNWLPMPDEKGRLPIQVKADSGAKIKVEITEEGWHPGTLKIIAPDGLGRGEMVRIRLGKSNDPNPSFAPVFSMNDFGPLVLEDPSGRGHYQKASSKNVVRVLADHPTNYEIIAPSQVKLGEPFEILVRLLDRFGNVALPDRGIRITLRLPGVESEAYAVKVPFSAKDEGWKRVQIPGIDEEGIWRIEGSAAGFAKKIRSNPIAVYADPPKYKIYWGDLQGHSAMSDGTGTGEEYYKTCVGPAGLDFASLSDHEWQLTHREWRLLNLLCKRFNTPGRFVPFLSWEYSLGGHRVVYYNQCDMTVPQADFSGPKSMWEVEYNGAHIHSWTKDNAGKSQYDFGDFRKVLENHKSLDALLVPHTSATQGMGNDWDTYDPDKVRLVEIYSAHGSNESEDTMQKVNDWAQGGTVQNALSRGARLGFIASGDSHDGKPGMSLWGNYSSGLTAAFATKLDRSSLWDALYNRRAYATTGPRILMDIAINDDHDSHEIVSEKTPSIDVRVYGSLEIARVDIVSNGAVLKSYWPFKDDFEELYIDTQFDGLRYYYIRVVQQDGHMAWSSPIWVNSPSVPVIKHLNAKIEQGGIALTWTAGEFTGNSTLEICRRIGNDGQSDFSKYELLDSQPGAIGPGEFLDPVNPDPGVSYYYLLRWISPSKPQLRLGIVSAWREDEFVPENGPLTIHHYAQEPGVQILNIYNPAGRQIRQIRDDREQPGPFSFTWDMLEQTGGKCTGLHFYQITSESGTTQRKPIRLPGPPQAPLE